MAEMARYSEGDVWDANNTCNVLWIPRSEKYDLAGWFGQSLITGLVQSLTVREESTAARWLGVGEDNDVVSCSWNKDTSSPAGVFSIALKPRMDYLTLMKPGDLVLIFMSDRLGYTAEERFAGTLVTIGLLDRVTQQITVVDGVDVKTVHINGRDFGAILQETSTVFDNAFNALEQAFFTDSYFTRLFDKQNDVSALSPLENVLRLLTLFYDENATGSKLVGAQWRLQGNDGVNRSLVSLLDITSFVQRPMFGYMLPSSIAVGQFGNVWSLLESFANRVVNEMFIDVRDFSPDEKKLLTHLGDVASAFMTADDANRQRREWFRTSQNETFSSLRIATPAAVDGKQAEPVCALVFRQLPYDRDAFAALPQVNLTATEVFDFDVGYATHDLFNFFRIRFPDLGDAYQELVYGIKVFVDSVFRHGIRRLEAESRYMFASSDASTTFDDGTSQPDDFSVVYDYYIGLLSTWYAANEQMLSGQISCRFRPEIRVGTRLRFTAADGEQFDFYVQGVAHNFSVDPGASRTTLTVVRGVNIRGTGLANNLIWTKNGPALPPELNSYIFTTAAGVELEQASGEKIINDQMNAGPGQLETDPDVGPVTTPGEE